MILSTFWYGFEKIMLISTYLLDHFGKNWSKRSTVTETSNRYESGHSSLKLGDSTTVLSITKVCPCIQNHATELYFSLTPPSLFSLRTASVAIQSAQPSSPRIYYASAIVSTTSFLYRASCSFLIFSKAVIYQYGM